MSFHVDTTISTTFTCNSKELLTGPVEKYIGNQVLLWRISMILPRVVCPLCYTSSHSTHWKKYTPELTHTGPQQHLFAMDEERERHEFLSRLFQLHALKFPLSIVDGKLNSQSPINELCNMSYTNNQMQHTLPGVIPFRLLGLDVPPGHE